jgi:phosphoribosylformylglycinamidine cyclo-ligase
MATYRDAGVNPDAAKETVERIKRVTSDTAGGSADGADASGSRGGGTAAGAPILDIGGFAAAVGMPAMRDPVILSATDGVGTKLEVALRYGAYETVGIDCVAMCVNDLVCHGAEPLFFLDYLACGRLEPEVVEHIVAGIAAGCRRAGCSLVGGETAEMPGFYHDGRYDIAGFAVGVAERAELIDGSLVRSGDVLIGLPASGVHSNGFSLVRHVVNNYDAPLTGASDGSAAFGGRRDGTASASRAAPGTVAAALLEPTVVYVEAVRALRNAATVHGLAHITGGGLEENVPRMWRSGLSARVERHALPELPIFSYLASHGIDRDEMFATFNMGVGMVAAVPPDAAEAAVEAIRGVATVQGNEPRIIGRIEEGSGEVVLV